MDGPLGFLITFSCYGARLHGRAGGSVGRGQRMYGSPLVEARRPFEMAMVEAMEDGAVVLDAGEREIVMGAMREVCGYMSWSLLAAHVRSNHVHAVVAAGCKPEEVMRRLKAYATRRLNEGRGMKTHRWARHGSTRYLWNEVSIGAAMRYVVEGQGVPMVVSWVDGVYWRPDEEEDEGG